MPWPTSLPTYATVDGFSEPLPNNVIRSQMDSGPPKVRRRGTAAPQMLSFMQVLTAAQLATLKAFYITTLSYGALTFTMTHPVSGISSTMRFLEPPIIGSAGGGGYYEASYKMEVLP